MANNPKKAKDPTEVALSAIQEALNISEPNADANRNAEAADLPPPPVMPSAASSFEPRTSAADRPIFLHDIRAGWRTNRAQRAQEGGK